MSDALNDLLADGQSKVLTDASGEAYGAALGNPTSMWAYHEIIRLRAAHARLIAAVNGVYFAEFDNTALWTELRDAAGIESGSSAPMQEQNDYGKPAWNT